MALRVNVIGGGVAGVTAARLLAPHFDTHVYDKAGRLSGRCASMAFRGHVVDQGAPHFSLSPETKRFLEPLLAGGADLTPAPGCIEPHFGEPQLYVAPAANALCERMADEGGFTVHRGALVTAADGGDGDGGGLGLALGDTTLPQAVATICTVPLPQAAALYPGIVDAAAALARYRPTLVAVLTYTGVRGGDDGGDGGVYARHFDAGHDVELVACESMKAGRSKGATVAGEAVYVVHGSEAFSDLHLEEDAERWVPLLRHAAEERCAELQGAVCSGARGKRWRYAQLRDGVGRPVLGEVPDGLYFAGDAAEATSGIEVALRSGARVAAQVCRRHNVDVGDDALRLL